MYVLILSITLSTESKMGSYDFVNKGKCERMLPETVQAAKKMYKDADILAVCLPKANVEDLKW